MGLADSDVHHSAARSLAKLPHTCRSAPIQAKPGSAPTDDHFRSDFIRAALDLFAYEREADHSMVLGAGVASAWLDGSGVAISGLRTPYGRLSYSWRREGTRQVLTLEGGSSLPPGGFVIPWQGAKPPRCARINGRSVSWQGRELKITEAPAIVVIQQR